MAKGRQVMVTKVGDGKKFHMVNMPEYTYCGHELDPHCEGHKRQWQALRSKQICINCKVSYFKEGKP